MLSKVLIAASLSLANADIVVSRTINSLSAGTIKATLDSGCTGSDTYGSNNCDLDWGKAYTGAVSGALTKDIEAGATFSADIKVDNIFPLKFTCPMCGGNCTITVPVVTKTVTFALPPCPIKAASIDQKFNFTLPSASPAPVKIGFSGKVTAVDKDGNSLADVDVTGDVTPTAVVVEAQDA